MGKKKQNDFKSRTVYVPDTMTKRAFRKLKEQEVKTMIGTINTFVKAMGFEIQGRIVFVHKETGEVFK